TATAGRGEASGRWRRPRGGAAAWFWNERFCSRNVTWADLAGEPGPPGSGLQYPRAAHVLSAFPLALGIFAVRLLFERGKCLETWMSFKVLSKSNHSMIP
uniref:Ceramide synthase 5 n=1 Tax=Malurus cyaneus samueli TaxID=2593467 RepID=A0A8C5U645_9PASS